MRSSDSQGRGTNAETRPRDGGSDGLFPGSRTPAVRLRVAYVGALFSLAACGGSSFESSASLGASDSGPQVASGGSPLADVQAPGAGGVPGAGGRLSLAAGGSFSGAGGLPDNPHVDAGTGGTVPTPGAGGTGSGTGGSSGSGGSLSVDLSSILASRRGDCTQLPEPCWVTGSSQGDVVHCTTSAPLQATWCVSKFPEPGAWCCAPP